MSVKRPPAGWVGQVLGLSLIILGLHVVTTHATTCAACPTEVTPDDVLVPSAKATGAWEHLACAEKCPGCKDCER